MSDDKKEQQPTSIRLWCPSVSKLVQFVVWDSHKLDIGSISRVFGLDPSTVLLNGHFISRGVDLVSSSVTWRSLLSFFSSKGLSTGTRHHNPLVVDGKLCKPGTKRAHEPQDDVNWSRNMKAASSSSTEIEAWQKAASSSSTEIEAWQTGSNDGDDRLVSECNVGVGSKRKSMVDYVNLLKKSKINETNLDFKGIQNSKASPVSSTPFKCCYSGSNTKRTREDEVIVGVPCKKITSG